MFLNYFTTLLHENQALLFFLVLGLGFMLGKIKFKGFEFGSVAGVLFVGLVFGHYGYGKNLPVQSIGFMMFIYSVGLQAGPRFFSVLMKDGLRYFILALVVASSGFAVASVTAQFFALEPGNSAGILAGALTTTPTLAAAEDAIRSGTILPPAGFSKEMMLSNIMTGYAITYLFGLIGLIPEIDDEPGGDFRSLGIDLHVGEEEAPRPHHKERQQLESLVDQGPPFPWSLAPSRPQKRVLDGLGKLLDLFLCGELLRQIIAGRVGISGSKPLDEHNGAFRGRPQ